MEKLLRTKNRNVILNSKMMNSLFITTGIPLNVFNKKNKGIYRNL